MNPPRTDHGPGWAFVFSKTSDGRVTPITVCPNILPNVTVHKGDLSLAKMKSTAKVDISLGLDIIADAIGVPVEAKANFNDKDTVKIEWGKAQSKELSLSDRFDAEGNVRPIDPQCAAVLKARKAAGEIDKNVFVVMSALEVEELIYNFDTAKGVKLDATVDIPKLLNLKPSISYEKVGETSLAVHAPRFVGYNAVFIEDFLDTGMLSPALVRIKALPVDGDRLNSLAE